MKRNGTIFIGILLILLGIVLLGQEIWPEYFMFLEWPFIIIGLGGIFLLWAILSGAGGLAVPGAILTGIGGIFYYQNQTGDWASWAYIWALIPALVGVGVILSGLINRNYREALTGGLVLLLISGMLVFSIGPAFGLPAEITQYWPVLLVLLGVIALLRALFPGKGKHA